MLTRQEKRSLGVVRRLMGDILSRLNPIAVDHPEHRSLQNQASVLLGLILGVLDDDPQPDGVEAATTMSVCLPRGSVYVQGR